MRGMELIYKPMMVRDEDLGVHYSSPGGTTSSIGMFYGGKANFVNKAVMNSGVNEAFGTTMMNTVYNFSSYTTSKAFAEYGK